MTEQPYTEADCAKIHAYSLPGHDRDCARAIHAQAAHRTTPLDTTQVEHLLAIGMRAGRDAALRAAAVAGRLLPEGTNVVDGVAEALALKRIRRSPPRDRTGGLTRRPRPEQPEHRPRPPKRTPAGGASVCWPSCGTRRGSAVVMTTVDTVGGTVYRVGMGTEPLQALDAAGLDLLAYDIADLLDRHGYDLADVADCDLRPHLEAFLAAAKATAAAREQETSADAASWTPADANAEPVVQCSRRPRMTYKAWWRSQTVDLGATAVDEWYWSCPKCAAWAGPYPVSAHIEGEAKRPGMDHVYYTHDLPAARAAESRRAVRMAARP